MWKNKGSKQSLSVRIPPHLQHVFPGFFSVLKYSLWFKYPAGSSSTASLPSTRLLQNSWTFAAFGNMPDIPITAISELFDTGCLRVSVSTDRQTDVNCRELATSSPCGEVRGIEDARISAAGTREAICPWFRISICSPCASITCLHRRDNEGCSKMTTVFRSVERRRLTWLINSPPRSESRP